MNNNTLLSQDLDRLLAAGTEFTFEGLTCTLWAWDGETLEFGNGSRRETLGSWELDASELGEFFAEAEFLA